MNLFSTIYGQQPSIGALLSFGSTAGKSVTHTVGFGVT